MKAISTKILVTGGAGYIGSHAVDELVRLGYAVVVYDNLSTGHQAAIHPEAAFIQGDLLDSDTLAKVFAEHRFDGIFHFASRTLVGESVEQPWLYLRDNVMAAANLLEAAVKHDVGRFILSSTANLFDAPQRIPIAEHEQIVPGSPYGESKAMIERQLYWMDRIYGLKSCALRYFNAAGAHPNGHIGEHHNPETHLIPIVLEAALGQREAVTIFGEDYATPDGTCVRDYIHVMDLVSAHVLAFEALPERGSSRYNLGNNQGYSVKEVIDLAREVTGREIKTKVGERRAGDPAVLVADSNAIGQDLGWEPRFADLRAIIQTAWGWHESHQNGYDT